MAPEAQSLEFNTTATINALLVKKQFSSDRGGTGVYPWLQRPIEWEDFTPTSVVTLGVVGTNTTILSFPVPLGKDGVVEQIFFNYAASAFNIGDIVFRMFIDGRPVKNLEAVQTNLGSSNTPVAFRLSIQSGNTVTLVASHVANGTLDGKEVSAGILGYLYRRSRV